jgi:hypothetical protein
MLVIKCIVIKCIILKLINTSHEHCEKNPILGKDPIKAFQHPSYERTTCEKDYCTYKLCHSPCGSIKKKRIYRYTHDENIRMLFF